MVLVIISIYIIVHVDVTVLILTILCSHAITTCRYAYVSCNPFIYIYIKLENIVYLG